MCGVGEGGERANRLAADGGVGDQSLLQQIAEDAHELLVANGHQRGQRALRAAPPALARCRRARIACGAAAAAICVAESDRQRAEWRAARGLGIGRSSRGSRRRHGPGASASATARRPLRAKIPSPRGIRLRLVRGRRSLAESASTRKRDPRSRPSRFEAIRRRGEGAGFSGIREIGDEPRVRIAGSGGGERFGIAYQFMYSGKFMVARVLPVAIADPPSIGTQLRSERQPLQGRAGEFQSRTTGDGVVRPGHQFPTCSSSLSSARFSSSGRQPHRPAAHVQVDTSSSSRSRRSRGQSSRSRACKRPVAEEQSLRFPHAVGRKQASSSIRVNPSASGPRSCRMRRAWADVPGVVSP